MIVDYFLKTKLEGHNPVKITVTDKAGDEDSRNQRYRGAGD